VKPRLLFLATLLAAVVTPSAMATCNPTPLNFTETVDAYIQQPAQNGGQPGPVWQVVQLSGTTSMSNNCAPPQTTHHVQVWSRIGTNNGDATGAYVCVSCYTTGAGAVSYPLDLELDLEIPSQDGGEVICSLAGPFFISPMGTWFNELAATYSKDMGPSTQVPGSHIVAPWCDSHTDPPDWNPDHILKTGNTWWPYYNSLNWCRRQPNNFGVPWECFGGNINDPLVYGNTDTSKKFCTKYDAGPPYRQTSDAFNKVEYIKNAWLIIRYGLPM